MRIYAFATMALMGATLTLQEAGDDIDVDAVTAEINRQIPEYAAKFGMSPEDLIEKLTLLGGNLGEVKGFFEAHPEKFKEIGDAVEAAAVEGGEEEGLAQVDADAEIICGGLCIAGAVAASSMGAGVAACYTYGSTVVRKAANGQSEAVPIEALKEGDQVLVKGASGLHFSEAVAVDLHAGAAGEVLSLTTRSGHQVSLTANHMVPVHIAGKEELISAQMVKPGHHVTVVNAKGETELSEVVEISSVSSFKGLANVLTGTENIVVNGVVGSIHSEFTMKGAAGAVRPVVKTLYNVAGARAARYAYRTAECLI